MEAWAEQVQGENGSGPGGAPKIRLRRFIFF